MNLLFNVSNLRFGGGISVARGLLDALVPLRSNDNIYIIAPEHKGYEKLAASGNVSVIGVPQRFHRSWPVKYYYNQVVFRRLVTQYHIDKVFSLGNIAFPSGDVPQLLLLQNAWPVYPDSIAWQVLDKKATLYNKMMNAWTDKNLPYAQLYALQTEVMRERFCQQYGIGKSQTMLLPNAVGAQDGTCTEASREGNIIHLLMLSKYYPHKNFDILLPLAQLIKEQHRRITITITINPAESAAGKAFLQKIKDLQLEDIIHNAGHIPAAQLATIYRQHDALLFPTLLESFSGTYIEAMHYGLPIFTSDLDFAKGVCGDAAFYFNPMHAEEILHTITTAYATPQLLQQKAAAATAIVQAMPSWAQIAASFSEIIDTFG
jgi:glycosyltransferase involved in cell wall biosynthesis